ncbi:MAG: hypothetical protein AAB961_01630 [Patescibacteria group bacterium]
MKLKSLIIVLILLVFLGASTPAFAADVAVGTASLVVHQAVADTRIALLRAYLSSQNSPFVDEANHFIEEADRLSLDWRLVAAISGVESTFGKQIPTGSYNAWGWGIPTGAQWGIAFADWKSGITTVSEGLKYNYIDRGAITIDQMGRIYAASPAWPWKVRYFIDQITEFAPNSPALLSVTI